MSRFESRISMEIVNLFFVKLFFVIFNLLINLLRGGMFVREIVEMKNIYFRIG